MRVLVVHGPNLNLLGEREPDVYGTQTLAQIDEAIGAAAKALGLDVRCEQHSGEGAIIDALHEARKSCSGVVINPGAYAHYSYAIADAIAAIGIPVIEVHLSNVAAREPFRRTSVTAAACRGVVSGLGVSGYLLALRALAELLA
jgi:3-dehydroquinate dehydratase II